ncbi:ABC transporter permease [Acuticoccus sp. I52.16.1]|uniref:ABC transporter permease n=1 Tax=Acuticoccus sp. I52.16.1 TaxID=2928472 RepID=UPI001FD203ED|nr:ABC transporter permease [Acuticoccus sp. I52.16.1]UOM35955.1 ABC transporter permease [Acuticoccus sp. I52.16.1]
MRRRDYDGRDAAPRRPRPAGGGGPAAAAGVAVKLVIAVPVGAGLVGVLLPAFGYLPPIGADQPGLAAFAALAARPGLAHSAALSVGTALAATLVSLAATASILAATFGTRAMAVTDRLLAPLLSVPHAAAALGFVLLFAPSGLVLRLLSPWATGLRVPPDIALVQDPWGIALTVALVMKETPFLVLMALAALGQIEARPRVAMARALGYGRMAAFLHGVWPLVYRQIKLPVLAVLAFCVSVVDVAMILGPTRPPPLAVRLLTELHAADIDAWLVGSAGAVLLLGLMGALVLAWLALERAAGWALARLRDGGWRARRDRLARIAAMAFAAALTGTMALAVVGLCVQSVAGYWPFPQVLPANVSAASWVERLPGVLDTLATTLGIAIGATALSLPLAVALLASGVRVGGLIYLPLIVPQVAFLFGLATLVIAMGVTAGPVLVTLTHVLFTLPYALIALSGPWAALDPRYEMAARSFGLPWWRRFVMVRLALLTRPLAVAAALGVAVSVALYVPTRIVGGGRVATITTEAVAAATGGDRRLVAMLALMQLALPFVAFALARGGPALAFRHRRAMQGRA